MTCNDMVFIDGETPVEALIEGLSAARFALEEESVAHLETARAKEGEAWSPQLLAYDEWKATGAQERPEADLLQVGFMTGFMAWENEERDKLVAKALAEGKVAAASSSAVLTPASAKTGRAFMVRAVDGGYALVGVDVRMLAEQLGAENMVLALPSYVGGVPVVRVTAEAFARRFVRGVDVRLLVVPDTVQSVDAGALSSLSVRHVHVGAQVGVPFSQPFDAATLSPRQEERTYSVAAGNAALAAQNGSLYSADKTQLLFLAPPYASRVEVPQGVVRVEASAFARSVDVPNMVAAPASLEHVAPKEFNDAVWLCAGGAPVRAKLEARGVRTAGFGAVEQAGCWYDFHGNEAVLVSGPPAPKTASRTFAEAAVARVRAEDAEVNAGGYVSPFEAVKAFNAQAPATDELVLPGQVANKPLASIGVRALATAPATVIVASTVRSIAENNACKGTRHLVLPAGLERIGAHSFCSRVLEGVVQIPATVQSIGEGCFEYAVCQLMHTGSVVHVSADQLLTCFEDQPINGVPFNFAKYDDLLLSGKNLPDKLGAVLHRISDPVLPAEAVKKALLSILNTRAKEVMQRVAKEGDIAMVDALLKAGFINESTFDEQIERLRECNRADCVLHLMEQRHRQAPAKKSDRFAL